MKDLIKKKLQLQDLANAFQDLARLGHVTEKENDEYWQEKSTLAHHLAGRLQGIPHASPEARQTAIKTLEKFSTDCLEIRETVTDQEGKEFWQNMHQSTSQLADELTDQIPAEKTAPLTPQAVY